MDRISGSGSRSQDYSYEELQELQKDTSTRDIMAKARKDAGLKEEAPLRGNDKSARELEAEHKAEHLGEETAEMTGELAVHHAPEVLEFGMSGALAAIAAPLVSGAELAGKVHRSWVQGQERKEATEKDETRIAMHGVLDLPKGFKAQEAARCVANTSTTSTRMKVIEELDGKDSKYKAVLQMHCDRGMHAAFEMLKKPGMTSEQFLTSHPNLAAAYKEDAAFRAGFDGLLWAKQNSSQDFDVAVKSLAARDVAYTKNHLRVQG